MKPRGVNSGAFPCKRSVGSIQSQSDKNSMLSDFQGVIDTFIRPLIVYLEATRTVIVSDPNYNPFSYSQTQTGTQFSPADTRPLRDKRDTDTSYFVKIAEKRIAEAKGLQAAKR